MTAETIILSSAEFEEIKGQLFQLDAELNCLLAPPLVYATVLKANALPLGKDGGTNVVVVFDGKLLEVHGLPRVNFKPSDNVKIDLERGRICS